MKGRKGRQECESQLYVKQEDVNVKEKWDKIFEILSYEKNINITNKKLQE